ncbi:hypothetical protein D3C85_1641890 [compost metagenome]
MSPRFTRSSASDDEALLLPSMTTLSKNAHTVSPMLHRRLDSIAANQSACGSFPMSVIEQVVCEKSLSRSASMSSSPSNSANRASNELSVSGRVPS